jgi:glyoxylase-like metal-dependent hydrolase (beta-lactamase superfamily II)
VGIVPHQRRLDRRVFLHRLGRVGVGLLVAGAAGCATDGATGVTDTASASGPAAAGGAAAAPSTPPVASPPASESSAAPTDAAATGGYDWRRVDLGFVSAYLLVAENQVVVVDTGVEGSETDIEQALDDLTLGWYAVEHVILTHRHPDHIGSVPAVIEAAPDAIVHAGQQDAYAIAGPRQVRPVADGSSVMGLQIIATPGHTPGHISVLDPVAGVLVAGDALVGAADGGGIAGPDAAYTADMETAIASVRKLAGLQFSTVLVGHGEPVEADGSRLVSELASRL